MHLSRKNLLPLALVVGLFGTPALAPVHVPGASGGVAHPPAIQTATAEREMRRRRRIRRAKVRVLVRRGVGLVRGAATHIRAAGERVRTRRPPHDSFARGPPRLSGL
ncbi:MAG TPA: hypothetical protein VIH85_18155 [Solirubrobacteraceae bacterium]